MSDLPHSRRLEQSGKVVAANVVGFAVGPGTLNDLEVVTDKHTKQIASLRTEIEEKNEEISKFNKHLKDLREQNIELKITVSRRMKK